VVVVVEVVPVTTGASAVAGIVAPMVRSVCVAMTVLAVVQRSDQRRPDKHANDDMAQCRRFMVRARHWCQCERYGGG
jgi:hypothetical protein